MQKCWRNYHDATSGRFAGSFQPGNLRTRAARGPPPWFSNLRNEYGNRADAQNINIELTVASPRPVELLFSQLSKLVDVACVEIQQPTSQQIRA
jgi:acetolactate synthase II small subunit